MVPTNVFGSICKVINIDNHVTIGIVSKYLVGMESEKYKRELEGFEKGREGNSSSYPPYSFLSGLSFLFLGFEISFGTSIWVK